MIRAYRLYTGPDGNSHVTAGTIHPDVFVNATSIHFKETASHSNYDWHNDPVPQYVLTLSGILEFTTKGGETFTLHPGDVLDRFMFEAPRNALLIGDALIGGEFAAGMSDESDARDLDGVEEEELCVASGRGVEVRVGRELCCSDGEGFAKCHRGQRVSG